jgi:glycerate kinase
LGAAFAGVFTGRIPQRVELVIGETGLREKLAGADLLITGEGKMDGQSKFGKAAYGIMRAGREAGVSVLGIVGMLAANHEEVLRDGFAAVFNLRDEVATVEESMARAGELLELVAMRVVRDYGVR